MRGMYSEKGDTLIEVLVAISVLAVVIVGAFSIMNKGVAQMYDTMEKSEVRLLLNRQTEALTYARDQYLRQQAGAVTLGLDSQAAAVWNSVRSKQALATTPPLDGCDPTDSFVLENTDAGLVFIDGAIVGTSDIFPSEGNGIWIQKLEKSNEAGVPYKDFYIRACWLQNSSSAAQVLSTVVRLYDR